MITALNKHAASARPTLYNFTRGNLIFNILTSKRHKLCNVQAIVITWTKF